MHQYELRVLFDNIKIIIKTAVDLEFAIIWF